MNYPLAIESGNVREIRKIFYEAHPILIPEFRRIDHLLRAIKYRKLSSAQTLLELGVPVNNRYYLEQPLCYAVDDRPVHHEIVRCLLKHGADPNRPDNHNRSALEIAVNQEDLVTTRLLLEAGAKPNIRPGCFPPQLPLLTAVKRENLELVQLLLEFGADPQIKIYDMSVLDVAINESSKQIIELLERWKVNEKDKKNNKEDNLKITIKILGNPKEVDEIKKAVNQIFEKQVKRQEIKIVDHTKS